MPENHCFQLLDRRVIEGEADQPALIDGVRTLTVAQVLGEVAAFAGVLRALGATPGSTVAIEGPWREETVLAMLATLRLGAVPAYDESQAQLRITVGNSVIGLGDVSGDVLEWKAMLTAGRTDPAPCATEGGHLDLPRQLKSGLPIRLEGGHA